MMEGGRAKLEAWSHTLGPGKGGKKTGKTEDRYDLFVQGFSLP